MCFDVNADGDTVYSDDASTGRSGVAAYDLKRVDAQALAAVARGNGFAASFAGDGTYSASSDQARFRSSELPCHFPLTRKYPCSRMGKCR